MKLDRKHIMADLATQQLDFVIDLEQYLSPKITFDHLVTDEFVICSQFKEVDLSLYIMDDTLVFHHAVQGFT